MRVRDATEADLPGILTIYNEVIRTSSAVYTDEEATLEDRRAWLAGRTGLGYPVLVAGSYSDQARALRIVRPLGGAPRRR